MVFELTASGRLLTRDGQCVTVQRNSYVVVDNCNTALNGQQRWSYDDRGGGGGGGRLTNPWSGFCAMHVTDPDNSIGWRQTLMAQNCTVDLSSGRAHDNSTGPFMRWTFTNP